MTQPMDKRWYVIGLTATMLLWAAGDVAASHGGELANAAHAIASAKHGAHSFRSHDDGFGSFGHGGFGRGDGVLVASAAGAGCLGDIRDLHQDTSFMVDVDQRTDVSFEDALLAVAFDNGGASIFDVLDVDRSLRVNRDVSQRADIDEDEAVVGAAARASHLNGGLCERDLLSGSNGHGGHGFNLLTHIGDIDHNVDVRADARREVDLDPDVILTAIAIDKTGGRSGDLSDLADITIWTDVDTELDHRLDVDFDDAIFALAVDP